MDTNLDRTVKTGKRENWKIGERERERKKRGEEGERRESERKKINK